MLIRCKIIRKGGSQIDIGGEVYHFAPNAVGDHVVDVKNKKHIERFLEIKEGYEIYGDEPSAAVEGDDDLIPPEAETEPVSEPIDASLYEAMTRDELLDEYQRIFGRNAPVATKHETLVKKLSEHAASR